MSFNELHITRANYEEFFLLYVDGELTPAQSDAVEAFAAQHPDLQEELDLLLTTRLDAEPVFFNKEALMADHMKHTAIDESLLLYIDNELNEAEKKAVEEKLESDTTYQYQHNLLRQAILPAEAVSYPNKAELYRKEERSVRPIFWYRAAAAVFVLLAAGYMWTLTDKAAPATNVAVQTPATKQAPGITTEPSVTTQPSTSIQEPAIVTIDNSTNEGIASTPKQKPTEAVAQHSASIAAATPETPVKAPVVNTTTVAIPVITENSTAATTPQQIINKQAVTTTPAIAYNKPEATDNLPGQSDAVAIETDNNKRGGSVKGFLRKATRFIERRTGVSATNENDELLIGALAINLK